MEFNFELEDRTADELRPVAMSAGIWLRCPFCKAADRLTGKLNRSGRWCCFNCGAGGHVDAEFVPWLAGEAESIAKAGDSARVRR